MMKNKIASLAALAALLLAAPVAMAQDDDEDLFGEDPDDPFAEPADDEPTIDEPMGEETEMDAEAEAPAAAGTHQLGIGFSTTVLGAGTPISAGGVEVEYWLSEELMINGLGRLIFVSPDPGDSQVGITVGIGGLLVLRQHGPAMLLGGGRFLLGFTSGDAGTTSIALEGPLRLQLKLAERLSVHVEGGVGIGIGDQAAFGGDPTQDFSLLIGTRNLFGSAGLTAYF